ncbi:diguanylate cyclase [Caballeronia arationis]|jgi:diguanylate cyclase (GGDEF)-like protein|uniref:Diguanylate cyclase (GGDEF) domain-containing protein n=1 Tax=Caballeronia arationis TaxID=1777142 RepID=A0A7Z7I967_9BURK|nr:GGDEF domain-containing protein [Caballeronia arationis]SAK76777.1 diguanylate cyclase [Caballeronia arationis]SOE81644.1 diguanylate cyclase (GGDEF) domain-containing protein [Caballeronia arationis]
MSTEASETNIPVRDPRLARPAFMLRFRRPGPALIAGASLGCLLIGLLFVAVQVRAIFSAQLQQEYIGLVLEAVDRAEGARDSAAALRGAPAVSAEKPTSDPEAYPRARHDLSERLATLDALVSASPAPAPPFSKAALAPDAPFDTASQSLDAAASYWRAQREEVSDAMRNRISRVADTLILLSAIVFGVLVTALGMYAKHNRLLAGRSHEFEHAALHDAMTGLPNRRRLFAALEATAKSAGRIAVLYIDLDGFKRVNDTQGHRIGDEFLIAVSRRFRQSVRTGDVVARIGGDEFAVLVSRFESDSELAAIAQRLIACVAQTDQQMALGLVRASIGIATFPDRVDDYWRLVAAADETMYEVKRNGKDGFAFASASS